MIQKQSIPQKIIGTLAIPVIWAAALLILCSANGKDLFSNATLRINFLRQMAIVMITTMALSVNLNSGRFDFSLGAMALLSSVFAARLTARIMGTFPTGKVSVMEINVWLMLGLSLVIGTLVGTLSGLVYVSIRIPPIITSLGITLIYEGFCYAVAGSKTMILKGDTIKTFEGTWVYIALIIAVVLGLMYFLFDRTRFGYNYKALQSGQKVSVNTGIREVPNAIACYAISGGLMGIVGFLNATKGHMIQLGTLNFGSISIMFTAFLPMFIGGYIGRFSNDKLGYLLAAACMALLNSAFGIFGTSVINASTQSIINAVLLVVFLIFLSNEETMKRFLRHMRLQRKQPESGNK